MSASRSAAMAAGRCSPNCCEELALLLPTPSPSRAGPLRAALRPCAGPRSSPSRLSDSGVGTLPIGVSRACGAAVDAAVHPLQHAHVLAEAGPEEAAVVVFAEPVDVEDRRWIGKLLAHVEPVLPVVAHVIAAERQHRHRVAARHADGAGGGGGRLGAHAPRRRRRRAASRTTDRPAARRARDVRRR